MCGLCKIWPVDSPERAALEAPLLPAMLIALGLFGAAFSRVIAGTNAYVWVPMVAVSVGLLALSLYLLWRQFRVARYYKGDEASLQLPTPKLPAK